MDAVDDVALVALVFDVLAEVATVLDDAGFDDDAGVEDGVVELLGTTGTGTDGDVPFPSSLKATGGPTAIFCAKTAVASNVVESKSVVEMRIMRTAKECN